MEIYKFEKTLLERMEELEAISTVSMSYQQLQEEWINFIEVGIEPSGWHALWKIPRAICEVHNIKYPVEVFGIVDQVMFSDLQAVFTVLAVQDESVHLPESNVVNLDELFVTKIQENTSLNVDITSDILDRWRFFNSYCKMPWDETENEDHDWHKHLINRLKLYYDLKSKAIKKNFASYIRTLIKEAKYIQMRREILETTVEVEEEAMADDGKENSLMEGALAEELFKLHLRLNKIKVEMEMLFIPQMRKMYEPIKFPETHDGKAFADGVVIVASSGRTVDQQVLLLMTLKSVIPTETIVHVAASLENAIVSGGRKIYLPAGIHKMENYMEYLNENISLCGLQNIGLNSDEHAVISSTNHDSLLMAIDGPCNVENIHIECKNVKAAFLIKTGSNIVIKNCVIYGGVEGLRLSGSSNVLIENCVIHDFAGTAISCFEESQVHLKNTIIRNCKVGVEISPESKVKLEGCIIENSKEVALSKMVTCLPVDVKNKVVQEMNELVHLNITITDVKFQENKLGDVVLYNYRNLVCNSLFFEDED